MEVAQAKRAEGKQRVESHATAAVLPAHNGHHGRIDAWNDDNSHDAANDGTGWPEAANAHATAANDIRHDAAAAYVFGAGAPYEKPM